MSKPSLLIIFALFATGLWAQDGLPYAFRQTPVLAFESNLLYSAAAIPNVGLEVKTGRHSTLLLPISYSPMQVSDTKKWKHVLIQPELRYWPCNPFGGHFWGMHAHVGIYNVGGIGSQWGRQHRMQGTLVGGGFSYGYQFYVSPRFNIEASIGAGYAHLDYRVFLCGTCGWLMRHENKHYLGPTKAAISLIYIVK